MRFTIYQESRPGGRKSNQDRMAYSYSRDSLILIVADGMGGHMHGEVAAQIAVQFITEAFQREAKPRLADPFLFLSKSMTNAHYAILDYAAERKLREAPRTTCVSCVVQDSIAYWAHAGDSRLYVVRNGLALAQTRDHSRVQRMVDQGLIDQDHANSHPARNRIFSCLGSPSAPYIDYSRKTPLMSGDVIALCSDGVWGPLGSDELVAILAAGSVLDTVPRVMARAQTQGGPNCDNLTMLGITWHDNYGEGPNGAITTKTLPLDRHTTVMEGFNRRRRAEDDWDEDAIERAIQEINTAISKFSR